MGILKLHTVRNARILSRLSSIEALELLDEVRAAALVQCQAFGRA